MKTKWKYNVGIRKCDLTEIAKNIYERKIFYILFVLKKLPLIINHFVIKYCHDMTKSYHILSQICIYNKINLYKKILKFLVSSFAVLCL